MVKIGSLPLLFMLFASLGFAWVTTPTSTIYSVAGANFTILPANGTTAGGAGYVFAPFTSCAATCGATLYLGGAPKFGATTGAGGGVMNNSGIYLPASGNLSYTVATAIAGGSANVGLRTTNGSVIGSGTVLEYNTTHYMINSSNTTLAYVARGGFVGLNILHTDAGSSNITFNQSWTPSVTTITNTFKDTATQTFNSTTTDPLYTSTFDGYTVLADFMSKNASSVSTSSYCQMLLYFNNPYYGNIQLIPKMTYIPNTDAFAYFINTTSNAAYIPNNTITYVFDSITSIWYIVPAITCASFSTVGSTTTLQYNPTATGTAPGGTVPIDVYYISGSCSYTTATRLISCTGTDTSNTITSLNLSAYKTGNATDLCANGTTGASGTLTCTLPAQNGTYNIIFYGQDANLFLHQFASKTVTVGYESTTYGKDTYIAVFLLVGVAALLMASNIAVSMVLTCLGLFLALAVGILPISDAPVVVFFTVIALVLAYRLKV